MEGGILDLAAKIAGILGFGGVIAAFWRLRLVNEQLKDLLSAKRAKIKGLHRAIRSLYIACQDISEGEDLDKDEIIAFNSAKLGSLQSSSDAFYFTEIEKIENLSGQLERLCEAVLEAQDDLEILKHKGKRASDKEFQDLARQLHQVYKLSGQCDSELEKIK